MYQTEESERNSLSACRRLASVACMVYGVWRMAINQPAAQSRWMDRRYGYMRRAYSGWGKGAGKRPGHADFTPLINFSARRGEMVCLASTSHSTGACFQLKFSPQRRFVAAGTVYSLGVDKTEAGAAFNSV
ncbi:hypothetical protein BaRGS_00020857 [Batillaria attramentaria]|uniref:Uncharacterized protein n=1 Tax=Batillaria attramentaria TaxID=370345 RepID=A0ABD0KM26_9CAEN